MAHTISTLDVISAAFTAACSLQSGSRYLSPHEAASYAGHVAGTEAYDAYSDTYFSSISDGIHACSLTKIVISISDKAHSPLIH